MNALTSSERRDLETLEGVVQRGITTFIEVGRALAEIRDRRLYRQTHGTLEDYCHEKWLLSRTRAYRLIDAAAVVSPMGDIEPPSNERQARELAPLKGDEAEVVAAWREAKAKAEELGTPLTAKVVRNAVRKRVARVERERRNAEVQERHMDSRCDGCGRTPRELEDAGVPLSSGWTSSFQDGVSLHLCWGCHTARLRQNRDRREREERELAERLGEEGYRQLQENRARDERRASASKQLTHVHDMLTGGRYGPEQSVILEVARWRDALRELDPDDLDPDEAQALAAVVAEAERLFAEIRSVLRAAEAGAEAQQAHDIAGYAQAELERVRAKFGEAS